MAFKLGGRSSSQDDFERSLIIKDRQARSTHSRKSVTATVQEAIVQFGESSVHGAQTVKISGHASTSPARPPFSFHYESPPLSDADKYDLADRLAAIKAGQEMTFCGSWRQHPGSGWSMNVQRLAIGSVSHDSFDLGSGNNQVLWHKGFDDRFLDSHGPSGKSYEVTEATPVKQTASMYFSYSNNARPGLAAPSTFEAILDGDRTSTTRYPEWGGIERWNRLKPGDLVRFFEDKAMKGRSVVVSVDAVRPIDLSSCSASELKDWSEAEGWSEDYGRSSGRRHGAGVQIRYHPVPGQAILEGRQAKCAAPEISPPTMERANEALQHKSAFAASLANGNQR